MDDFVDGNSPNDTVVDAEPRVVDKFIADATSATEVGTEAIPKIDI